MNNPRQRVHSLDVLRGMDLFLLTVLAPLTFAFSSTNEYSWLQPVLIQFSHVDWEGFRLFDLIMPLFMFLSGATIPFSFTRDKIASQSGCQIAWRLTKRFLLLWLFGMMAQGQLLSLSPSEFRFYSNTLQTIAVGYVSCAVLYIFAGWRARIAASLVLMLVWSLSMEFISIDGSAVGLGLCGAGDMTAHGNLCECIDCLVLGSHRDGASWDENGQVIFAPWYTYTWLLSSLNFIVTVMAGVFAGEILKSKTESSRKVLILISSGLAMALAGWLLGIQEPIIKHIWSSSFTLVAAGYSWIALGIVSWIVDVKRWEKPFAWLKVFGCNSLLTYMIAEFPSMFSSFVHTFTYGLQQYVGAEWYGFITTACSTGLVWCILRYLYKMRIFLRV